jgi:hypothetical protein
MARVANVNDMLVLERLFLAAFAVMARIRTEFADKGYNARSHCDLCRASRAEPCFRREECAVDGSLLLDDINQLLAGPTVALQGLSSHYENATDMRPRHFELWFGPGAISVKPGESRSHVTVPSSTSSASHR